MLLLLSITFMLCAVGCLHCEAQPRYWHLSRHLLALSGFWVALSFVCVALWAWRL